MDWVHEPVLTQEVVDGLSPGPKAVVLDMTVGLGGHAEALLKRMGPSGFLIGVDRDAQALEEARKRLKPYAGQMKLLKGSFGQAALLLDQAGQEAVDAVLFDLGVSSMQLAKADRGFSFLREGPLDMRMDADQSLTAWEIVNRASPRELVEILQAFGQERWCHRISRALVRARPITSTTALAEVIRRAYPAWARRERIDPATRAFQAIRIAVNDELGELERGLHGLLDRVKPDGRIAVIAYHSLEDRRVKETFRTWAREARVELATRKPIAPSQEEVARNPRSRSARLRIARRIAG
ncbi:MAG: 16S rRNA (cytosine(1402)-N(4))-methyltransferase RsmH [Candidatus Omnitrophica bacterium]|nr:16S rRNA (cytosine(1402)-N(4))-methyltransferase RsmH [Candidatus Omnitrophota bacterium]